MLQSVQIGTLRNNPQILIRGQHLGSPCAEYRLRICQDDFVHDDASLTCKFQPDTLRKPLGIFARSS
jgi:hypothetical protein